MYDINAQHCDYPSKVNCTGRPKQRKFVTKLAKLLKYLQLTYINNTNHCNIAYITVCFILLEEPQPSKNCPRANGFFPFPAEESCQKFWDCRGGTYFDIYN